MPSLRLHASKFPNWRFLNSNIVTDEGGEAILFSTDDPGRAEGWHPKISNSVDPVYIIVDEAKTVPDRVFEAFDRCSRRFQLFISTPGDAAGQFYRSHRSEKALFWTKKITSLDCPHIDPNKIERDRLKYGEDHPLFKSMHLAEFDENADSLVLSPLALTEALKKQPEPDFLAYGGEVVAFCDFAAGGDENVLAVRRGNHVRIVKAWHETNTVQAVREFISLFRELSLTTGSVFGDAGGLGGPMLDLFAEEGFPVRRIHNVSPAREPEAYSNLGSEAWFYAANEITLGRINLSDTESLEPQLFSQLTSRPRARDARQRLRTLPKEDMAKLGLKSPDRADALVGAIYCGSYLTGAISASTMRDNISMAPTDFHVKTEVF